MHVALTRLLHLTTDACTGETRSAANLRKAQCSREKLPLFCVAQQALFIKLSVRLLKTKTIKLCNTNTNDVWQINQNMI